jgi:hypothetical protein
MSVAIDRSIKLRSETITCRTKRFTEKKKLTEREGLVIASADARTAAIAKRENFILN